MARRKLPAMQRERGSPSSARSHPRRSPLASSHPSTSHRRRSPPASSHPSSSLRLRSQQLTTPPAGSHPRISTQATSHPSSSLQLRSQQSTTPLAGSTPRSSTQASSQPASSPQSTSPSARSHRRSYNRADFGLWIVRGGRFRKERKVTSEGMYVRVTTPAGRSRLYIRPGIASADESSQQQSSPSAPSNGQSYKPKDLSFWVVRGGRLRKVSLAGKRLAWSRKTKCGGKPQPFD